jgi:hypothetical protein
VKIAATAGTLLVLLAGTALAGQPAERAHISFSVSARVLERTEGVVLRTPETLVVTSEDAARGYVDVVAPTELQVTTNNPDGCLVSVSVDAPVRRLEIAGVGQRVALEGGRGWLPFPYSPRPTLVTMSFRVYLSENVLPGSYPWPVHLAVRQL